MVPQLYYHPQTVSFAYQQKIREKVLKSTLLFKKRRNFTVE